MNLPVAADLMNPIVVLVMLKFGPAVVPSTTVLEQFRESRKFAIATYCGSSERESFLKSWRDESPVPLLLFRSAENDRADIAIAALGAIVRTRRDSPLAILLSDGPEITDYFTERRNSICAQFAEEVHRLSTDAQIFLYSSSWLVRPPRIR